MINDIEKENYFGIREVKTDKNQTHLLVKSELKVSTLEIIQKLKIRNNNQDMENLKKVFKKILL